MRILFFITKLCLVICVTIKAQAPVQRLDNVPEAYAERYQKENHEYNPLHVGDIWQFVNYWGIYSEIKVDKDTTINNQQS